MKLPPLLMPDVHGLLSATVERSVKFRPPLLPDVEGSLSASVTLECEAPSPVIALPGMWMRPYLLPKSKV